MKPTDQQMDLLRYVAGFKEAHRRYPTDAEITAITGQDRPALAALLQGLTKTAYVRRSRQGRHSFDVLASPAIPRDPDGEPLYFVRVP